MRYILRALICISPALLLACHGHNDRHYLGYVEGRYTYLSSPTSGRLMQLFVHKGENVKKGTLAYQLDLEPELSQLNAAKATMDEESARLHDLAKSQRSTVIDALKAKVRIAASEVKFSKKTYERNISLYHSKAIGQAELDRTKSLYLADVGKLKAARADLAEGQLGARKDAIIAQQARVRAAKAQVAHLSWLLNQKRVTIPSSGFIENTFYRVGEFVPQAHAVVSLLTPNNRYLVFFIPENHLSQLKMGAPITFTCDGCKHSFHANVDYISSRSEYTPPVIYSKDSREKLVYYVEAKIDPQVVSQFHPGQPVQVKIS